MKKINVLLAALLSVTVLFGAAVPANAASADVNIEIKATTMDGVSVTVPTQLPILFNADGTNTIPDNWNIKNVSSIAGIHLEKIDMTGNGWKLLPQSAVISELPVNSHSLRFYAGPEGNVKLVSPTGGAENASGSVTFEKTEFSLESGADADLLFDVERGAFDADKSAPEAFEMVLTFKFN